MLNPKSTNLQKGLTNDVSPANTQIDNPTFVLNGVLDSIQGDKMAWQSEPGNSFCYKPEEGFRLIGEILGDDNEHFLFFTNGITSIIGILKDCNFSVEVESKCLSFDAMITGEFRIRNGCERVIYFRDSVNKDRSYNFDRPELFQFDEYKKAIREGEEFDGEIWDCDLFSLNVNTFPPCVETAQVIDSGGSTELGVYYFILELLDLNQNVLYRTKPTNPVPIWDESIYDSFDSIDGGFNVGSPEIGKVSRTSKSIRLGIENIDTSFDYIRVSVLKATTGTGTVVEAFRDKLVQITGNHITYTFTGTDHLEQIDPTEVLIPIVAYDTSKVMEQIQNRLVRANVTEKYIDLSAFQRSASKIKAKYVTKTFDPKNQFSLGNPKNPNTWFESMSFMGDEVYAMSINYVMNDGRIVESMHIPGQAKNVLDCEPLLQSGFIIGNNNYFTVTLTGFNYGLKETHGSVVVKFRINGVNFTETRNYSFDNVNPHTDTYEINKIFEIYSGPETPTNINITLNDDSGYGNITTSFNIAPYNVHGSFNLPAYTGWDDTVYPEFFPIMTPLIKDATVYQQMVESVGGVYGDYSVANLNLLKQTDLPKRWEIMNTAIKTSPTSGRLAYYECTENYPEIYDCDGNSIWGVDACGNELIGTPIRHPKFPDRSLEPLNKDGLITLLGIEFDNIEYPSTDVVGHFFSRAKRDDINKTVLDKGLACSLRENDKYIAFSFFESDSVFSNYNWLMTPKTLLGETVPGSYLKVENVHLTSTTAVKGQKFQQAAKGFEANDVHIAVRSIEPTGSIFPLDNNFKILSNKQLEVYGRETIGTKKLINFSNSNRLNMIETDRSLLLLPPNGSIAYVSVKDSRNVYCDLFNIEYFPMHHCYKVINDEQQLFAGDTFISNMAVSNHFLSDVDPKTGLLIILAAIGVALSAISAIFTFGLTLPLTIALAAIVAAGIVGTGVQVALIANMMEDIKDKRAEFTGFLDDTELSDAADKPAVDLDGAYIYYAELLNNFYVESEINFALRHSGSIELTKKFEQVSGTPQDVIISYFNYIKDKILELDDEGKLHLRSLILPESYLYNRDYSRMLQDAPYFPLELTYNFCSKCGGEFPNRIIFSPVSFENETFDLYRINLANDFIDISAEKGEITGLEYKNNQLLVHTTRTSFLIRPNPQTLQTSEDTVHIGVGDFLSIPPVELSETDIGYGGLQNQLAATNTQFGRSWVDQNQGKVLNWSNEFSELSLVDEQWFKENLPGGEVKCTYDPRFNRLIIYKTHIENGENKSWTRSYSYLHNYWSGFHSYLPEFAFYDRDNFYTYTQNGIFKHLHNENYQTFYEKKHPFIIEYVSADLVSEDFHTLSYYGSTQRWDSLRKKFVNVDNVTFDKLLVYNEDQSSGLLSLEYVDRNTDPYGGLVYNPSTKTVVLRDNTYKVAQIRDVSTGRPTMSSDWVDTQADYFIDAVPINFDFNTAPFNLGFVNGKWNKVRLFFKPEEDLRKIIYLINDNQYGNKY